MTPLIAIQRSINYRQHRIRSSVIDASKIVVVNWPNHHTCKILIQHEVYLNQKETISVIYNSGLRFVRFGSRKLYSIIIHLFSRCDTGKQEDVIFTWPSLNQHKIITLFQTNAHQSSTILCTYCIPKRICSWNFPVMFDFCWNVNLCSCLIWRNVEWTKMQVKRDYFIWMLNTVLYWFLNQPYSFSFPDVLFRHYNSK